MPDFPLAASQKPSGTLTSLSEGSLLLDNLVTQNIGGSAAAWPAANAAVFIPVVVPQAITIYQMALIVAVTAAGNVDVGIYDTLGNRLVSAGPTAIAAAGLQTFDIANTLLKPDNYFLAGWCSTITTATFRGHAAFTIVERMAGVQRQTALASGLPATATFANPTGTAFVPQIFASFNSSGIL